MLPQRVGRGKGHHRYPSCRGPGLFRLLTEDLPDGRTIELLRTEEEKILLVGSHRVIASIKSSNEKAAVCSSTSPAFEVTVSHR